MHDITALAKDIKSYRVDRLVLHPRLWKELKLPVKLTWNIARFNKSTASKIPKTCGVYAFIVRPKIANNNYASYLLYIGKTEQQEGFRGRYRNYLQHAVEARPRRPSIRAMFDQWPEHFWFCYARIEGSSKKIDTTEKALIGAYLPPYCKNFPGKLGKAMNAW